MQLVTLYLELVNTVNSLYIYIYIEPVYNRQNMALYNCEFLEMLRR
jgi:hypothetical protein